MPHKNSSRRLITPLLLFTLAGWALWAVGRNRPAPARDGRDHRPTGTGDPGRTPARARSPWSKRRLATSLAFVTLFFGGAAFSAGAGDVVVGALEGDSTAEVTSTEEQAAQEAPAEEEAPAEDAPAEEPSEGGEEPQGEEPSGEGESPAENGDEPAEGGDEPAEGGDEQSGEGESPAEGGDEPPTEVPSGDGEAPSGDGTPDSPDRDDDAPVSSPSDDKPLVEGAPNGPSELDPEAEAEGFFATVWLHHTLPDPTPPAERLEPAFAKTLVAEARRARVDWALVLAVLRAQGFDGGAASTTSVRRTADRLADLGARRSQWRALLAYRGRTAWADRTMALTRYNRAVGLNALVTGLTAAKPALQRRVLADRRLDIYAGGRFDIAMGRTDVRVLVLLRYMADAHGQVTVSSLTTGHGLYSRPGVISAHVYGLAVDISGLGGRSITGNQEPGGLTERAVRNVLLLPRELQPRQVISLLGLGGPSFPMANHHDHIHVGY